MERHSQNQLLITLQDKINELALGMEKMKLAEYVRLLENPRRLMYVNFIAGVARGWALPSVSPFWAPLSYIF